METGNKLINNSLFWDKRITKNKAQSYQLLIHYSFERFSYCVFDIKKNEFLGLNSYETNSMNNLNKILKQELFNWNFQSIKINTQSTKSTIIPTSLFEKNIIEKYLYFNDEFDNYSTAIFSEQLKYMDAMIIYALPKDIITIFQQKFEKFETKSHSSIFIDSILRKSAQSKKNEIFIDLSTTRFDIGILKKSKLFLYNHFSFSSKNDFLYYVLNCYNTLNLDPNKDKLHIFGEFKKNEFIQPLKEYLKHIIIEKKGTEYSYSNIFNNMPDFYFHKLFNLTTCG